ncbi:hypothetical protein CDAR_554351 [Caerostris darwini]|uniref:Uncharacterized protein n=1 Tax=Caerostris darwini TaxID=1538125 RepID=A0AAV4SJC4_9ARAC|nr:hypothetical protein CDAR_554351 [Caerostris darwini]
MEAENQFAVLETTIEPENNPEQRKTRLLPFFILPDQNWPQLSCKQKSQVPSLISSLSRGRFLKCAHCAVEYTTTECTQPKESSKTCVNCKGSHIAYWRGCSRFPRKRHHQSKRKLELIEKAPIRDSENFPQLQHLIHPQSQLSTKELPMRTSFQSNHINNHPNKQNQLRPYDANPLINSPRRNKWARCTESLSNSSPRTTNNSDEKSCIILEHYGALIFN